MAVNFDARKTGRAVLILCFLGVVLWAVDSIIGLETIVRRLAASNPRIAVLVAPAVGLGLVARGIGLWIVFQAFGETRSLITTIIVVPLITFVNRISLSGQAGGTPVNGLLMSRFMSVNYETGLAAVISTIGLNNVIILLLGFGGASFLSVGAAGQGYGLVALTAGTILGSLLAVGLLFTRYGARITASGGALVDRTIATTSRRVPRVEHRQPDVSGRVESFRHHVGRLARSPRHLVSIMGVQTGGRLMRVFGLYLAFQAVGIGVHPGILLVIMPVAMMAAVIPLPGAGGGVEATLVTSLVVLTGHGTPVLTAGVILFRIISVGVVAAGATVGWAVMVR